MINHVKPLYPRLVSLCLMVGLLHNVTAAQMQSLNHNGLERTYLVHLPPNYSEQSNLPLVIAMHGGFGSANNLQNQSQLSVKADEENFIVVYPEGVQGGFLDIPTWNGGGCCGYAMTADIDDVGFINVLLDQLLADYAIDSQRIYATGMSNGGILSYRLACELSDRIAAIAPVACAMILEDCQPSRPVPIIHFHSYLDSNIIHSGGVGMGVSMVDAPAQLDNFARWSSINGCQIRLDTLAHNADLTHTQWRNCDCDAEIQYFLTQDGGHSWPGGMATPVGDRVSQFINANDLMWDFFKKHKLPCAQSTAIPEARSHKKFEVHPTISSARTFKLVRPRASTPLHLEVMDVTGQAVPFSYQGNSLMLPASRHGIYYLKITVQGHYEIHPLIIP